MAQTVIKSRRNGLVLAIPNTEMTSNLMQRFQLKGDNELIFQQAKPPTKEAPAAEQPLVDTADVPPQVQDIDDMM